MSTRSWDSFFTLNDFYGKNVFSTPDTTHSPYESCEIIAEIANAILRKHFQPEEVVGESVVNGGKIIFTKKAVYRFYEDSGEVVCTHKSNVQPLTPTPKEEKDE